MVRGAEPDPIEEGDAGVAQYLYLLRYTSLGSGPEELLPNFRAPNKQHRQAR